MARRVFRCGSSGKPMGAWFPNAGKNWARNCELSSSERIGSRVRAYFAQLTPGAVPLRRLKLPAASNEEGQRLLRLQIEREFPLAPDALAWGSCRVEQAATTDGKQELLVAAVKKEVVEDYAQVLSGCAATPLFTVAALARSRVCPSSVDSYALLDIGRQHSELLVFTHGVAESIRILAWGGENITDRKS